MKWLYENNCYYDETTFAYAALNGNLENMKWLLEKKCKQDEWTFACGKCKFGKFKMAIREIF
jgi:hypothetical protein